MPCLPRLSCYSRQAASIFSAACLVILIAGTLPAQAAFGSCGPGDAGATTCGTGPATLGHQSGTNQGVGNPINIITGNKYQREEDLPALPGVLGLEIVRHYNSAYSTVGTTTGILGRGWKLSYETDLYAIGNTVQIIQADGTRIIFNRDPNNRSLCSTNNPADGTLRIDATTRGDEYVWTWANGRVLSFNNIGKLVQIAVPTGEFVSLQHDPKGMLVQVTDPQGRQLKLQYPSRKSAGADNKSSAGFRGVMTIDSPVGRYAYAYGSALPSGSTVPKSSVLANMTKVVYPGNTGSRLYHYEDAQWPTFLSGISVASAGVEPQPNQRISTYLYDTNGKAILTVKGTPARLQADSQGKPLQPARLQDNTGIGQLTLDHSTPGRTVVTNSLGQTTVYRHAIINSQYRLLEVLGAGCSECGDTNVRYAYDKLGRLIETMRLNQAGEPIEATRTALDDKGIMVGESTVAYVSGKAQPAQWRTRYVYSSAAASMPGSSSVSTTASSTASTTAPTPASTPVLQISRPSVMPGRERQTTLTSNALGQLLSVNETGWAPSVGNDAPTAISRTTTYRYKLINGRSVLVEIDGPLADGAGNSPADSDITRISWDGLGSFMTALIQPGGATSQIQYDDAGRAAFVRNEQGLASRYTYHFLGMLQRVTQLDAQGKTITQRSISHDVLGRAVELGDGEAGTPGYLPEQRRAFDTAGQLLWQAQTNGVLRQATYDTESRLTQVIVQGAGQRQQERYVYGKQSSSAQTTTGTTTKIVRDDFGREITIFTASHGRTLQSYDAADRMVGRIDAQGERTTLRYDVQGNLLERQVHSKSTPAVGALITTWRYAAGRLGEVRHPGQIEHFEYDASGRQIGKTITLETADVATTAAASTTVRSVAATTRTRYLHNGSLAGHSLPDGSWLQYERDRQGQIVALYRQASTWLPWGWNRTTLVSGMQRDLVGLSKATYGNGIEAHWQRSAQGAVLARVVYTRPEATAAKPAATTSAATAAPTTPTTPQSKQASTLPGALGLPIDPQALFDARLLYDPAGNVLLQSQHGTGVQQTQAYAYDERSQLIAAQRISNSSTPQASTAQPGTDQAWRYAYDTRANRVLAQENVAPSEMGQTRRVSYGPTDRAQPFAQSVGTSAAPKNTTAPNTYIWGAMGQLQRIERSGLEIARYRYDAQGLRMSKITGAGAAYYLHDQERQRVADLDAQGRILRQYVWVDGKLLATIDPAKPRELATPAEGVVEQVLQSAKVLWRILSGQADRITYVHANHLGAPIAATDNEGKTVWQTDHAPYGKLIQASANNQSAYRLDLRLPGQWEDAESGLYYNDARHYDPEAGRYLSADPLGHVAEQLGSTNAYSYVNNNPASYVDPLGLILFAFDGTGNSDNLSDPAMNGSGFSNVRRFFDAYDDGNTRYVSGVGTVHRDTRYGNIVPDTYARNTRIDWITPSTPLNYNDMGGNYSGPARIDRMMVYMRAEADAATDTDIMQVDIVGFSRGAAQAREFANRIVAQTKNGGFNYIGTDGKFKCQMVNFRFMGLFDTVLSTNYSDLKSYKLGIPSQFTHVAHAVALNEYRSDDLSAWAIRNVQLHKQHYGGFPLESIGAISNAKGKLRIERGFIGSHADIGGGYKRAEDQLSFVALNWMVRQAQDAGVKMDISFVPSLPIENPVVHDQSNAIHFNDPAKRENIGKKPPYRTVPAEDRTVNGAVSGNTQRTMGFDSNSMQHADTRSYIRYTPRDINERSTGSRLDPIKLGNKTGTVDIEGYLAWLRQHDYCFVGDTKGSCSRSGE